LGGNLVGSGKVGTEKESGGGILSLALKTSQECPVQLGKEEGLFCKERGSA